MPDGRFEFGLDFGFFLADFVDVEDLPVAVCGSVDGRCLWLGLEGRGAALVLEVDVVEGEPELEVDVVELDEDEEELELDALLVVVDEVEDNGEGAHDSLSEATTPWIGRFMLEIGVPAATFTLNVYVWPPTTVTVTVQASADALGSAITPIVVNAPTTSASTNSNFRLPGNCGPSPLPSRIVRGCERLCPATTGTGRY